MADGDGGGGGFWAGAVVLGILLAVGAGSAGSSGTSTTTTTSSGSSTVSSSSSNSVVVTNSSTAPAALSNCPGHVVRESTENDITLRVYYDPQAKGVNCVAAVRHGSVSPPSYLQVELRVAAYSGTEWPQYATQSGAPGVASLRGIYLVGTDNRCVTAVATYFPAGAGGPTATATLTRVACG
jgi:hypothetical protein